MTKSHCSIEEVRENVRRCRERVAQAALRCGRNPDEIRMMAVTKTVPAELVNAAIDEGITLLGENRAQEFVAKREDYRLGQAEVHFIGHLQSNKIKYIADHVTMIESVSSCKLAERISFYMQKTGKTMDILLQVNVGKEESKSGFYPEELVRGLEQISCYPNIRVKGLMCIPPIVDSERHLERVHNLLVDIKGEKLDNITMGMLSMGMSGDFETAVQHGSTEVRLGTVLFGRRTQ